MANQQRSDHVATGLKQAFPPYLVDELLEAHREAKRNYYTGGNRLSGVEAGRFCEAALRLLEHQAFGQPTPLGQQLDSDNLIRRLSNLPRADQSESVRLHIPRCIRMVYDVRNKRDLAHLADGIDPNVQDATLVAGAIDWILAEFVRLHHNIPPDEAHAIIVDIVTRTAPSVEDFDGFLKVLRTDLRAGDCCLLLLYVRGERGATAADLRCWMPPRSRTNLQRTLNRLSDEECFVVRLGEHFQLTRTGVLEVERRQLVTI